MAIDHKIIVRSYTPRLRDFECQIQPLLIITWEELCGEVADENHSRVVVHVKKTDLPTFLSENEENLWDEK